MKKNIPISSAALGRMELQKSPFYEKIPEQTRADYIKQSLQIGKQAAQKMESNDIFYLLKKYDIQLKKEKTRKTSNAFILRGEIHFTKKNCEIKVYEDSVQDIYKARNESLPKDLIISQEQALAVHLSHEFFHYLEFRSGETVSERLKKVEVPLFFHLTRKVEISECSEIAAHAFAKQFCQLKVLPNYYDLHYLLHHHEETK